MFIEYLNFKSHSIKMNSNFNCQGHLLSKIKRMGWTQGSQFFSEIL